MKSNPSLVSYHSPTRDRSREVCFKASCGHSGDRFASIKSGWYKVGDKEYYLRSLSEYRYAIWLHYQKRYGFIKDWEYEPQTFWFENIKRGVRSYKPDFKVTMPDATHFWVEVKGYMDAKSATKIRRFNKYYPCEELRIVDKLWFNKNARKLQLVCKDWR